MSTRPSTAFLSDPFKETFFFVYNLLDMYYSIETKEVVRIIIFSLLLCTKKISRKYYY